MLGNVTLCVISFFEMLISYIFFSKVGERKYGTFITLAIGTLLFESASLLNILLSNIVWLNTLYFAVINVVFACVCFQMRFLKVIFYAVLLDTFTTALEYVTIFLFSVIFQTSISAYNDDPYLLIIEGAVCKILYFITCLILLNFIKNDRIKRFPISFHIYPLTAIIVLTAFWYLCFKENISDRNQLILAIISLALFGSVVLLFITYQHNAEKENEYFLLKVKYDKMSTDQTYYSILERQNQQLMTYAHDTKNHLATIKSLNTDPRIDGYIDRMQEDLRTYSSVCHSGNITLDVIVSRFVTEASIKNIDFSFDIRLNNLSFVDDYDLVAILGNLLDNAFEAADKSTQRTITLDTDYRNNYSVIVITNSCDVPPTAKGLSLKTTKQDKSIHGLGLKSTKNTLKKYQGDLNWEYVVDKRLFVMTVMLKKD